MKNQRIIKSGILGIVLFTLLSMAAVNNTLAGTVNLPTVKVPKGGSVNSGTFRVTDKGSFQVKSIVKVDIICFPFVTPNNSSRYRARLMRGTTSVAEVERVAGCNNYIEVNIPFTVADCSQTGTYHVRFTNTSTDNPQQGLVEFFDFIVPTTVPATAKLDKFGLGSGNNKTVNIPFSVEPKGSGGTLRITGTWDSGISLDLSGNKLVFILKRNDNEVTRAEGYAHNALFGNASPKMTVALSVPESQVSGDWTFEVRNKDSNGSTTNIEPTVSFTPRCQS